MTLEGYVERGRVVPEDVEAAHSSGHAQSKPKRTGAKEDETAAWQLHHQINGLRRRTSSQRSTPKQMEQAQAFQTIEGNVYEVRDDLFKRYERHEGTESLEANKALAKSGRVSSKPMVFHEPTQLWFRAKVVEKDVGTGEVKLAWDGKDNWEPVWMNTESNLIWRGSMRTKDWKHVSDGGWLPKGGKRRSKAGKAGASGKGGVSKILTPGGCRILHSSDSPLVQNPCTPPLGSPNQSSSEVCSGKSDTMMDESHSSGEEAATKKRKATSDKDEYSSRWVNVKSEAKPAKKKHSATSFLGQQQADVKFTEIKEQQSALPIKILMKKAFAGL